MRLTALMAMSHSSEFYTGKQGSNVEVGLGGNVVTRLTRDLVGQFYHVFMDNFF